MSNGNPTSSAPWWHDFKNVMHLLAWLLNALQVIVWTIVVVTRGGDVPQPLPPIQDNPLVVQTGGQGWVNDPDAVNAAMPLIEALQGMPVEYGRIARDTLADDDDRSVFFWDAEQKVLRKVIGSWDQGAVGTCVSFAYARGVQDVMLLQIADGAAEQWPGDEVATEPIYALSRVEVGGGRIRGDGSVGAWAAQAVQKFGVLFRKKYLNGKYDLSTYSEELSRHWGAPGKGLPDDLEPFAREHPVKTVALVQTGAELWAALGNKYPTAVCSSVGFKGRPPSDGIMEPRGEWRHAMLYRGRFIHPTKGKCVVIQNSWGKYLGPRIKVETKDRGTVELPEGCFAVRLSVAERMLRARDTFALSGVVGFPRKLEWPVQHREKRGADALFAGFDLAR